MARKVLAPILPPPLTSAQRDAIPTGVGRQQTGALIFNTDSSRYEVNLGTDASPSWAAAATILHAASHAAGAADALAWTTAHGQGTLAARPAAASSNAGYTYLATDVNGGTNYRSDGASWTQAAHGVSIASSEVTLAMLASNSVDSSKIADGSIVNADVNSGAALALSKLAHLLLQGPDDATQLRFAYGHTSGVTVGPNPATYGPVSFGITFASAPTVFVVGNVLVSPADTTVSTTQWSLINQGNGTDARNFNWLAIGPA